MAKNDQYIVANPTIAAITTDAHTVGAGAVKIVTIEDESHAQDLVQLICQGCVVAPASASNATATVAAGTTALKSVSDLVQEGAELIRAIGHTVLSAAGDAHAAKGL